VFIVADVAARREATSKIAVVTDTGCDLPQSLRERHDITIVPLVVRFGREVYLDHELTPDEFWTKVLEGSVHPHTSQPSAGMFEEVFAPLVEQGYHVVCPTVTSNVQLCLRRFPELLRPGHCI